MSYKAGLVCVFVFSHRLRVPLVRIITRHSICLEAVAIAVPFRI